SNGHGDTSVQELTRQWLRAGEIELLAKAVLTFPEHLPRAFPADGELATRKLELAEYLRSVDPARLPSDAAFFRTLNRHALSSSLQSQADSEMVRSLREEFGAAGLAQLIAGLPPRPAALLFALAPVEHQEELARL